MRRTLLALVAYLGLAFIYLGVPIAAHPEQRLVGQRVDVEIFVWSLAWWPHAILHGENPFVTHAIWAPEGVNLAWTTSIPGLAVLAAPITLIAGPAFAYNLLAVAIPGLAAFTAFLLCRRLTRSFWASLAGGYLFGFSPYLLGQSEGHMHESAVFLIPLVALVVVRYFDGDLSRRRTAVYLGVLIALQLWFSTEVALTLTIALAVALGVGFAVARSRRSQIARLLPAIVGAYALAAVLTAPLLAYVLLGYQHGPIAHPRAHPADLLNLVVPTHLTSLSWHWTDQISATFWGSDTEQGAYLGLPTIAIVLWYVWAKRRTDRARFLAAALLIGLVAELGLQLHVRGHAIGWLPWDLVARLPVFDNILPVRLSMFVSLGAAVAVASWAASNVAPRLLRTALPLLAIGVIVPSIWNPVWLQTPTQPAFYTDHLYRNCLAPNETVLLLPLPHWTHAMLWQAESDRQYRRNLISKYPYMGQKDESSRERGTVHEASSSRRVDGVDGVVRRHRPSDAPARRGSGGRNLWFCLSRIVLPAKGSRGRSRRALRRRAGPSWSSARASRSRCSHASACSQPADGRLLTGLARDRRRAVSRSPQARWEAGRSVRPIGQCRLALSCGGYFLSKDPGYSGLTVVCASTVSNSRRRRTTCTGNGRSTR